MTKSVAIVTGASSGIGKATALRLARDFAAVVLVARSGGKLSEIAEQIGGSCESLVLELDLMSPAAADQVVKATLERFGRIKALINVAGAVPGLDLFLMTDEQWDASMQLKFHGARRLTIAAWEALKASKGAVVFTSGNAAVIPKAGAAAVGSINAAIEALAKAFAERGVDDSVQVNCVSPGAIMRDDAWLCWKRQRPPTRSHSTRPSRNFSGKRVSTGSASPRRLRISSPFPSRRRRAG